MVETSNGDGRNYEGNLRKWTSHEETMEYIKNMIGRLENLEWKPQD